MENSYWNLQSPSPAPAPAPAPSPYPASNGISCKLENCSSNDSVYCYKCIPYTFPPPPPPPPPVQQSSFEHQIIPYLITLVCVLGISFLILTTCTILLGQRWSKNRRNSRRITSNSDDEDDYNQGSIDHPIWHITTIGLSQSIIDSITSFKYHKYQGLLIDGTSDCSICLTEFEDGDDLRLLPKCNHAFHISCIDTWLRSHKNCPVCRAPIVNESAVVESVSSDSDSNDGGGDHSHGDDCIDHGGGRQPGSVRGESSRREMGDRFGVLPIEGTKVLDEIMNKKGRKVHGSSDIGVVSTEGIRSDDVLKGEHLRVHSDLSCKHYRAWMGEDVEAGLSRSFSFNIPTDVSSLKDEGTSSKQGKGIDDIGKDTNAGKNQLDEQDDGRNESSTSIIGSMKNNSIGRLLQKGPVSMKRSISSSSGKFFSSFRRSKSQASVLPL